MSEQRANNSPDSRQASSRDPRLLSFAELGLLPATTWLITGKIQARALNVLFGASESCKSLIAIYWALVISQTQPVIIIAGEGLFGLHSRIQAAADYFRLDPKNIYVWREPICLMQPKAIMNAFVQYAAVVKPSLVIVDTLAQCMAGGNENSPDMITATDSCGLIQRALNCAVLLLHHEPRNAKHERGHGSLRGAADVMLRTERKNKKSIITLSCEKTKDYEPFASERYRLTRHLCSVILCDVDSITGDKLKILRALNQAGMPLSKLLSATKIPRGTLTRLIPQLKTSGHVRQPISKGAYELTTKGKQALFETATKKAQSHSLKSDPSKVRLQKVEDPTKSQKALPNQPEVNNNGSNNLGNSKSQVSHNDFQINETETTPSLTNLSVCNTEMRLGTEPESESVDGSPLLGWGWSAQEIAEMSQEEVAEVIAAFG